MTPKAVVSALVSASLVAVLFFVLRPICPHDSAGLSTSGTAVREGPRPVWQVQTVPPEDGLSPQALVVRRNLFAFVGLSARHAQVAVARQVTVISPEPPVKVAAPTRQIHREPDFPYKYIGRFGSEQNPIAVFVANGDVVNAQIGDSIAGEFRLGGVGIESVEIVSGTGALRRVSLQK